MLNPEQQAELSKLLDTDLFKRAQMEVIQIADRDISGLLAPEAGIQMAQEKGVRAAFTLLRKITIPKVVVEQPKPKNLLK